MNKHLLPFLLLLPISCQSNSIQTPPIERSGAESQVRAYSAADADRVVALMERLAPQVREIKRVERPAPLVVLCTEELPWNLAGLTTSRMIVLGPRSRQGEEFWLAHELSHWFADETWHHLPYALEEGMAEYVASLVVPIANCANLQMFVFALPENIGIEGFRLACAVKSDTQADRTNEEEVRVRSIGLAAASAIGVEQLRQLCERASREGEDTIPFEWILDALPFDAEDPGSFRAAIRRRLIAIDRLKDEEKARAATAESPADVPPSK